MRKPMLLGDDAFLSPAPAEPTRTIATMAARFNKGSAYLAKRRHLRRQPLTADSNGYAALSIWRQQRMPWLLEPGGPAIFFRLIGAVQAIPTADLYRHAGASAPKLRKTLNELHRLGLVTVTIDTRDRRREVAQATDRLRQLARCYAQSMIHFLAAS